MSQLCSGRHGAMGGVSLIVVIADWLCRVLSRARWARTCYTPVGRQRTTWSPQTGISLKARDASRGSGPPPALPHSIPCLRHQGPGPLRLRRERGAGSPRRSGLWVFLVERGSESAEPLAHWAPNATPPQCRASAPLGPPYTSEAPPPRRLPECNRRLWAAAAPHSSSCPSDVHA